MEEHIPATVPSLSCWRISVYKLRVSKVPPEFWEEANQALLLWEQGTERHEAGYLAPIRGTININEENTKRMMHTSKYYYIGMLLED